MLLLLASPLGSQPAWQGWESKPSFWVTAPRAEGAADPVTRRGLAAGPSLGLQFHRDWTTPAAAGFLPTSNFANYSVTHSGEQKAAAAARPPIPGTSIGSVALAVGLALRRQQHMDNQALSPHIKQAGPPSTRDVCRNYQLYLERGHLPLDAFCVLK